jgi:hypothetical protein
MMNEFILPNKKSTHAKYLWNNYYSPSMQLGAVIKQTDKSKKTLYFGEIYSFMWRGD